MTSNKLKINKTDLLTFRKRKNMRKIILQDWKVNAIFIVRRIKMPLLTEKTVQTIVHIYQRSV